MSDADGTPTAADGQQSQGHLPAQGQGVPAQGGDSLPRNRAAQVSGVFALGAIGALGNFATGIALINPGIFVALAALCALIAIPVGHVGRFRGKRLGGSGRGVALAAILTGWLVLLVCLLAALAFIGLVAGLAALTDNT
ncbi:DUF4190 domain-containing protein [Streptomyces sp. NBC_00102]|uniref:DUF4190 domain-containing protein n=1 Tax=Streptomyces sp. NBC_00102 TaxID=2975652 RepID=UPI00224F2C95|nr:DUF4190 domain-containing protein [Streptomyces sp. NBC_00102]MCX5399361.1 DUF4190 domain-containing protein [Streptomyces sp. NBC_00102]